MFIFSKYRFISKGTSFPFFTCSVLQVCKTQYMPGYIRAGRYPRVLMYRHFGRRALCFSSAGDSASFFNVETCYASLGALSHVGLSPCRSIRARAARHVAAYFPSSCRFALRLRSAEETLFSGRVRIPAFGGQAGARNEGEFFFFTFLPFGATVYFDQKECSPLGCLIRFSEPLLSKL